MKKNYLVLLIVFISPYLRAEIAFTQIKGLYKQLPDDKKHLSPVHGFNWWKTGIIENFWIFGNQNHHTIKLIHDLFYLQPDGVTFDITTLNSKPAKYFTPAVIGKILAIIDHHTAPLSPDAQESLTVALFESIKRILNFDQLVEQFQQKIGEAKQELVQLKGLGQTRVKLQKSIISNQRLLKQLQANLAQQEGEKATQTHARIQTVQKEIAAASDEIEDIKQRLSQRKKLEKIIRNNDLTHASLRKLVASIVGSLKETLEEKYVPYTTHQILLAFLWNLVNDKAEFASYFEQVGIPITTTDLQQTPYTQAEFKEFQRALRNNPELVTSNYPLNSFAGFANRVWGDNKLPLLITSIGDAIYQADGQKYEFADCGETSLRNFFNILIYNQAAGSLDFALLQQTAARNGFTLNPQLVAYYQTYNDITKIQTKPYYDAWAQLVSGLPGVEYENEPGYEISAGLNNMMKVVNHLLFNNDKDFEQMLNDEKLDYLVEKLSRLGFSLTWKAKKLTYEDAPDWDEGEDAMQADAPAATTTTTTTRPTGNDDGSEDSPDNATPDDSSEYSDSDSSSSDDDEPVTINRQNTDLKIIFTINKKTRFIWIFDTNHFVIEKPQKSTAQTNNLTESIDIKAMDLIQKLDITNILCWYTNKNNLEQMVELYSTYTYENWDEQSQDYLTEIVNTSPSYTMLLTMALDLRANETLIEAIKTMLMQKLDTSNPQLIQNMINKLPTHDAHYADELGASIIVNKAEFLYPMLDTIPIGGITVKTIIENKRKQLYPLAHQKFKEAYNTWLENGNYSAYTNAISLEEFNEFPERDEIKQLYKPLIEIEKWTNEINNRNIDQFPIIKQKLDALLSKTITKQIDAALFSIVNVGLNQITQCLHNNESCLSNTDKTALYAMIISIIKITKEKQTIEEVGYFTLEDQLDQLYEPLHQALVANPDFHDLIIDIIKEKGEPLYDAVREVAAITNDVELLAKAQAAIRQKQIQQLYPLADEIQARLNATGKELDEGDGSAAATTTTTTTSFMYNLMNLTVQFVQNLFGQVANTLALRS